MAYTYTNSRGTTYVLHGRETTLRNGLQRTLYFFAKDAREDALDSVPAGYEVMETKNGLPVLKRDGRFIPPTPVKTEEVADVPQETGDDEGSEEVEPTVEEG